MKNIGNFLILGVESSISRNIRKAFFWKNVRNFFKVVFLIFYLFFELALKRGPNSPGVHYSNHCIELYLSNLLKILEKYTKLGAKVVVCENSCSNCSEATGQINASCIFNNLWQMQIWERYAEPNVSICNEE